MKRARISVDAREAGDRIRRSYDGTVEIADTGVTLRYRETGEDGIEGEVEIAASPGGIVIERRGSARMTQRLLPGLPTAFTYSTSQGQTEIRVDTQKLRMERKEGRGRLFAKFVQRIGGEAVQKTLEIKYAVAKD